MLKNCLLVSKIVILLVLFQITFISGVGTTSQLKWTFVDTSSGPAPLNRNQAAFHYDQISDAFYLFGGKGSQVLADFWKFNQTLAQWTSLPIVNGPGTRFSGVSGIDYINKSHSRFIFTTGESNTKEKFNDIWAFDIPSNSWSEIIPKSNVKPPIRYGDAGGIFAQNIQKDTLFRAPIVITHGFSTKRYDDTWSFNFTTNEWKDISPPFDSIFRSSRPRKRCLHGGAMTDFQSLHIFGGCTSGEGPCPLTEPAIYTTPKDSMDLPPYWQWQMPLFYPWEISPFSLPAMTFCQNIVFLYGPSTNLLAYVDKTWHSIGTGTSSPSAPISGQKGASLTCDAAGKLWFYGSKNDLWYLEFTPLQITQSPILGANIASTLYLVGYCIFTILSWALAATGAGQTIPWLRLSNSKVLKKIKTLIYIPASPKIFLLWFCVTLYLIIVLTKFNYPRQGLIRMFGHLVLGCMSILLIPVNRTFLSTFNISFPHFLQFHRIIARILICSGWIHMISMVTTFSSQKLFVFDRFVNSPYWGLTSLCFASLVLVISLFRRMKYSIFKFIHLFSLTLIYLFAFFHTFTYFLLWMSIPLTLYFFDLYQRYSHKISVDAQIQQIAGHTILTCHLPKTSQPQPSNSNSEKYINSFCRLTIPSIHALSHPFSVFTVSDDSIQFCIRHIGPFTSALASLSQETIPIHISRPHPQLSTHADVYIAGGVGITGVYEKWLHSPDNTRLIWITRSNELVDIFLKNLSKTDIENKPYQIFITSKTLPLTSLKSLDPSGSGEPDNIQFGRPDLSSILTDPMIHAHVCGPHPLVQSVAIILENTTFEVFSF